MPHAWALQNKAFFPVRGKMLLWTLGGKAAREISLEVDHSPSPQN